MVKQTEEQRLIEEWADLAQAVAEERLARYAKERDMRLIDYSAAWQRKWDEAAREERRKTTALWRVK